MDIGGFTIMEKEKVLVRSKQSLPIIPVAFIAVGICGILISFLIIGEGSGWSRYGGNYWTEEDYIILFICLAILITGIVFYIYSGRCSMVVTDRRIYGKVAFGAQIDLPLDMISAVGVTGIMKGIVVATSSGRIKFMYVANASEIHAVINDLLMNRQESNRNSLINTTKQEISNADELIKFKKLLDSGIISQEEFEAKKKQLLKI